MITYQEELIEDILEETKDLLIGHWTEVANHKDKRPLNPDFEKYVLLNRQGSLKLFTVRYNNQLVGYATFFIAVNLHYKDWKYANCDVYYLDPSMRKQGVGTEMFKRIEEWLKGMGVVSVLLHEKTNHSHPDLFKSLDYTHVENVYEKVF